MSNNNTLVLDFEKNIVEIEAKIESLKLLAKDQDVDIAQEVNRLEQKLEKQVKLTYANLTPWQKLQVSRHPQRPHCLDYVHALIEDFTPLCGDRLFGDDEAMIGGIGRFKNISVVVIGQEKGSDLETRMKHNFGMAKPEGYRKAQRLMDMADKFNMPVIAFVDTDGAFPGIDAEARGQAEAIASSIEKCLQIHVPIISIVIGMGGDEIIKEPVGGAHRDPKTTIEKVGDSILKHLKELLPLSGDELKKQRTAKFLAMGRNLPEN